MNLVYCFISSIFIFGQIQEVKINDQDVVSALNAYLDTLNANVPEQRVAYHLIARVENLDAKKIIYVAAVTSIGRFWNEVPDSYSKFGNRLVFWYERKKNIDEGNVNYREFHKQFGDQLINDRSEDGVHNIEVETQYIDLRFIGTYRFLVKKNQIKHYRKVCTFPDSRFYDKGYVYNDSGDLMFNDGAYDICSLDRPYRFDRDTYDPFDYIRTNSGIPLEVYSKHNIGLDITIDKKGETVEADIEDADKILSEEQISKLTDVILKMPNWNPQTVKGKKVCYRITTKL